MRKSPETRLYNLIKQRNAEYPIRNVLDIMLKLKPWEYQSYNDFINVIYATIEEDKTLLNIFYMPYKEFKKAFKIVTRYINNDEELFRYVCEELRNSRSNDLARHIYRCRSKGCCVLAENNV